MDLRMAPVPIVRWQLGNAGFRPMLHPRLAEGSMSAPAVSSQAAAALQKAVDRILDALMVEIQAVGEEFNLVSPAAVRVEPQAAQEISYIGKYPAQEIRSAVMAAARELSNRVDRLSSGALAPYLSGPQAQAVTALRAQVQQLLGAVQNQDMLPIDPGHQADAQAYLDMHLASVTTQLRDAERGVVEAEAGSVPVLEPSERGIPTMTLVVGGGAVIGIGILLWLLS